MMDGAMGRRWGDGINLLEGVIVRWEMGLAMFIASEADVLCGEMTEVRVGGVRDTAARWPLTVQARVHGKRWKNVRNQSFKRIKRIKRTRRGGDDEKRPSTDDSGLAVGCVVVCLGGNWERKKREGVGEGGTDGIFGGCGLALGLQV